MPIATGTYELGPDNASLQVKTGHHGAAAKAGHDLVIDVTSWQATLDVAEDPAQSSLKLSADPASLRVREGSGGVQALSDSDKAKIDRTTAGDVLRGKPIEFRSTRVVAAEGDERLSVSGELELAGQSHPVELQLSIGPDGRLSAAATLNQPDWGIKPYSALFGALKVADAVEIVAEAELS
ncbi:MAG: YceI family protein [Solirubrobacterales bacterium]